MIWQQEGRNTYYIATAQFGDEPFRIAKSTDIVTALNRDFQYWQSKRNDIQRSTKFDLVITIARAASKAFQWAQSLLAATHKVISD